MTEVHTFASDYSVWGDQDEVGSEDTIPCNFNHATLVTDDNGTSALMASERERAFPAI